MKVVAIGRTDMLYESIRAVENAGHDVTVVLTTGAASVYRRQEDDFEQLADEIGAAFMSASDISSHEVVELLEQSGGEIAISVNWPTIIPEPVRNSFHHGIVNCHVGDLPQYRGNATMNWAIIEGESEAVVTLHQMDSGLDSGAILSQESLELTEETYIKDVYRFAEQVTPKMFVDVVDGFETGTITPRPQPDDPAAALRCYPRIPEDSYIDWSRAATYLARLVRASAEPLPGAYTYLDGDRLSVWRAHAESPSKSVLGTPGQIAERRPESGEVAVVTGDGFLVLERVQLKNNPRVEATTVIESHRTRLGIHLPTRIQELEQRIRKLERREDSERDE